MRKNMEKGMEKDLVSVIMPTYNRAYIITRSIKCVLGQTYRKVELLIIDDGSTDETKEVVSELNDGRIRYLKLEKNHGANYARNQGLAAAKGEYIAFLDSDNVWEKIYLERRLEILKKSSKNVGGVFGYTRKKWNNGVSWLWPLEEDGKKIAHCRTNVPIIKKMLFESIIDTNTIVLKRACLENVSGFCEELRRMQEWEYFFRILHESGYRIKFTEDCLVRNYLRKDCISNRNNDEAYWETRLFFLKKYKEVIVKYGCFEEVVCHLLLKTSPFLSEEKLCEILDVLETDRIKKIMWRIYKKYAIMEKQAKRTDYFVWLNEKNNRILNLQSRWMALMQDGINLSNAMLSMGYQNIAIYGYGHLGRALYRDLSGTECHVAYIIDKRFIGSENGAEVIRPKANIRGVDAVIVTAVAEYEQIKEKYEREVPYISVIDIIEAAEKEKTGNE